jgi:hypothetical protein
VYSAPEGSIVLRVHVLSTEYTDWSPDCAEDYAFCYFWYRYRAHVKDVIAGTWSGTEVEFTHLQHGQYIPDVTNDCYVVLYPAGTDLREKIQVPFVADRILSRYTRSGRAEIKALLDGT